MSCRLCCCPVQPLPFVNDIFVANPRMGGCNCIPFHSEPEQGWWLGVTDSQKDSLTGSCICSLVIEAVVNSHRKWLPSCSMWWWPMSFEFFVLSIFLCPVSLCRFIRRPTLFPFMAFLVARVRVHWVGPATGLRSMSCVWSGSALRLTVWIRLRWKKKHESVLRPSWYCCGAYTCEL